MGDAGHLGELRGLVSQTKDGGAAHELSTASLGTAATLGDLGSVAGDVIHMTGTNGDGTTFSYDYTVTDPATTLSSFAADLNTNLAGETVKLDANNKLVVTDNNTGTSQLSAQLTVDHQAGSTLNFGDFSVTADGYNSTVAAGSDAVFRVDGATYTESSNTISDVIDGVTLNLQKAAAGTVVDLSVSQDTSGVAGSVQKLVDAYNGLAKFITLQVPHGVSAAPPLAGDAVLRTIRFTALDAMQHTLASGVAGDWTRLGDIGIAVAKDGTFTFDKDRFQAALDTDAGAVKRLFGLYGTTSDAALGYVQAGDNTQPGTYGVDITQAATLASATSAFTSGLTGDITITDKSTGNAYTVTVDGLATAQDLADALATELATATQRTLTSGSALTDTTTAAPATQTTALADLSDGGGGAANIQAGDTFNITGTRADGTSFETKITVSDPTTETLGTLQSAIQAQLGNDATAEWVDGMLVVTAADTGSNLLGLSVGYTSQDGTGTFSLGGMAVSEVGRGAARIDVSTDGTNITFSHEDYGSNAGFTLSGSAAGALAGITSGTEYVGKDVAGTIGGHAATGSGRTLTGSAATAVDGLMLTYDGVTTGDIGSVTFSRGVASQIEQALSTYLDPYSDGSIQSLVDRLNGQVTSIQDRQSQIQGRLDRRHDLLVQQFTAMEMALSKAQSQSQWLSGQIGSLAGYGALLGS